jgi:hypothetical protein
MIIPLVNIVNNTRSIDTIPADMVDGIGAAFLLLA